jgi:hypothetical protein
VGIRLFYGHAVRKGWMRPRRHPKRHAGEGKGTRTPAPSFQTECSPRINDSILILLFQGFISSWRL